MNFLLLIILGLAPSFIWLLFYLRKDAHPESKKMILKIFFFGMIVAFLAAGVEIAISWIITKVPVNPNNWAIIIIDIFIGVALVEEGLKYLVTKREVLNSPEFDEPLDAMLYMVIVGLGFAASENLLILLGPGINWQSYEPLILSVLRFLGATFLHALCSGLVGYFLVLSLLKRKHQKKLLFLGLGIATILHGAYNFSIMRMETEIGLIIPIIIIIGLALFISSKFKTIKKIPSICLIKQNKI